jgi:hypothetical protein
VRRGRVVRKRGRRRTIIKISRSFIPDALDLKLLNSIHLIVQGS